MKKTSEITYSSEQLQYFREDIVAPLLKASAELTGKSNINRLLTQADLAESIGISPAELSRRLNGTGRVRLTKNNVLLIVVAFIREEAITSLTHANTILKRMDIEPPLTFDLLKEQYSIGASNEIFKSNSFVVSVRSTVVVRRSVVKSDLTSNPELFQYTARILQEYEQGKHPNAAFWSVPPLSKVYVPLRGEECNYVQKPGQKATPTEDVSNYQDLTLWSGQDLQEKVITWLEDKAESPNGEDLLVLFGGYGTGKSSFSVHLAVTLLEQNHRRIPVLIRLAAFGERTENSNRQADFDSFIVEYLRENGWEDLTIPKLEQWAREGRLLFIFDGFDEMVNRERGDNQLLIANFSRLKQWAMRGNKVLVTIRPEYFFDSQEVFGLMQTCRRFYCHLLDEGQIETYLKKRVGWENEHNHLTDNQYGWEEYRDFVANTYHLYDLQHRFVLLEMIVQLLPGYIKQSRLTVTRNDLYTDFMKYELKRHKALDLTSALRAFSVPERLKLMEELAYQLYCSRHQILLNELRFEPREAWDLLEPYLQENELREELRENWNFFLMHSLLNRVGHNRFEFSHKSFFEYLVARYLDRQLRKGDLSGIRLHHLSREISDFVAEFNPPTKLLIEEAECFKDSEVLTYNAGQLLLSVRLYKFNQQAINQKKRAYTPIYDSSYITALEYYVFLAEREQSGYIHHPDHWLYPDFGSKITNSPITGLLDLDAQAFCEWLNARREESHRVYSANPKHQNREGLGLKYHYRLPQIDEESVEINQLLLKAPHLRPWSGTTPFFKLLKKEDLEPIEERLRGLVSQGEPPESTFDTECLAIAPVYIFSYSDMSGMAGDTSINTVLYNAFTNARKLAREEGDDTGEEVGLYDLPVALNLVRGYKFTREVGLDLVMKLANQMKVESVEAKLREHRFEEAFQELGELKQRLKEFAETDPSVVNQQALTGITFLHYALCNVMAKTIAEQRETIFPATALYGQMVYFQLAGFTTANIELDPGIAAVVKALVNLYWRNKLTKVRKADPSFPVWETLLLVLG
ncbi:MAG: NACHT domain-containing protein [Chloroflexota bacterium]